MRYVLAENSIVTNATIFEGDKPTDWNPDQNWVQSDDAQIGWSYDGAVFTPSPAPPATPLTHAQQRAAKFLADSDLGDFRALISSAADPAALKAKVAALTPVQKQNLVLAFMLDYVASGRG